MPMKAENPKFKGFRQPKESWSKLPHEFIELLPQFDAMSELKVTIYILRHTWGYREYGKKKRLTIDDFVNGRKYTNGKRIDNGTGLSEQAVRDGLKKAIEHGFITCDVDDSDKARVKKYYGLNLAKAQSLASGVQDLDPQLLDPNPQDLDPYPQTSIPRTKKETKDRNHKKDNGGKPLTPFVAMKNAIQDAFGYDKEKMTDAEWSLIGKAASQLIKAGATPDDMKGLHKYCEVRFDDFGAMALSTNWSKYQKNLAPARAPLPTTPPANFDAMPAPVVVPAYVKEQPHD